MSALRAIAVLAGLLTAGLCSAQSSGVDIDVSRDYHVVALADAGPLAEAILDAVSASQRSSQENPADRWDEVFEGPNWIHVRLTPARLLLKYGNPIANEPVSEILVPFPTRERGRRGPISSC